MVAMNMAKETCQGSWSIGVLSKIINCSNEGVAGQYIASYNLLEKTPVWGYLLRI